MQFIRAIRITDFRSLPRVELNAVDNIVPIVGPNGSGKSNMLRALNLFFNGEVENGMPLDLGRDFHDPGLKRMNKKQVEVELDMHFGSGLRSDLQQPIDRLAGGNDVVTIRKRLVAGQGHARADGGARLRRRRHRADRCGRPRPRAGRAPPELDPRRDLLPPIPRP